MPNQKPHPCLFMSTMNLICKTSYHVSSLCVRGRLVSDHASAELHKDEAYSSNHACTPVPVFSMISASPPTSFIPSATSVCAPGSQRTTTQPPPPAPVSLAPRAPDALA